MRIKTFLAALALMAAPGFALAQGGCNYATPTQTTMSCAAGSVFDADSGTCVPSVSS